MLWSGPIYCLGLLSQLTRDEEEFVTELRSRPEGWLGLASLAALLALGWAIVWMYRREGRRGTSRKLRTALAVMRVAVMVLLAAILLEPVRVRLLRRWVDSYTIVLVDDSSSMDLADRYTNAALSARVARVMGDAGPDVASGGVTRRDIADRLLAGQDRRFIAQLAKRNRVKVYRFSDMPELMGTVRADREAPPRPRRDNDGQEVRANNDERAPGVVAAAEIPINLSATGSVTNIERAVRRAIDSVGSAPISGVVVLSDGGFNQGAASEDVANLLAERRLPAHVIGIGDPSPPRNVRVSDVVAPENVFLKDPFAITARISVRGLTGQTIQVQLWERGADSSERGRLVDTRAVPVAADRAIESITFERRPERTGRFVYTVTVAAVEGESITDDNSQLTSVNVIESKTKVLLVAGAPGWDYRYLSRLLERDPSFDVSCWLQSADLTAVRDGNTIIDHLPRLAEELFDYDVIVLLDPDRSEFDDSWCRMIDTWVTQHGGGLLFAAARAYSPGFLRDEAFRFLTDLLPVTLDPEADLLLNRIGHYQFKGSPIEIPEPAFGHPVLRMADDIGSNKLIWREGNDVFWHFPVLGEKPAATVLMRHGDPRMRNNQGGHVLAAVQFVASGRSAFLAFDGTWRWRKFGETRFNRFWIQLVRYLSEGKLLGGARRTTLVTDREQYSLGETVDVSARLLDTRYEPIVQDEVPAVLDSEDSKTELVLRSRGDRAGWFQGRFVPDRTGNYRVSVTMIDPAGGPALTATKEIYVTRPNIEMLSPRMDRASLRALAEHSFGGAYHEVDEAMQLPEAIADLHEEIIIRSRPTSLWDNGWALAAMLGLLIVEWGLRKWNRLL